MYKTKGQRLYEAEHSLFLPCGCKNENHTPWRFITAAARQRYERYAVGHWRFTNEPGWFTEEGGTSNEGAA